MWRILNVSTGNSMGNCTGNFAGAARGLPAPRMLFLPAGVYWNAAGRLPGRVCRMKFLHVELEFWTALWALEWMTGTGLVRVLVCLKNWVEVPVELDEFLPVYLSLLPFWRISRMLVPHVEVYQDECGFDQPYLLEIWSKTAAILTPCWILRWTE